MPQHQECLNAAPFSSVYQMGEKIGEGGLASVFCATDLASGEDVAVKRLSKDLVASWTTVSVANGVFTLERGETLPTPKSLSNCQPARLDGTHTYHTLQRVPTHAEMRIYEDTYECL